MHLGFLFPRTDPYSKIVPIKCLGMFPRRIQNATPEGSDPIILKCYLSMCSTRIRRLLAYPIELRREVGDSMALVYSTLSSSLENPPVERKSDRRWWRSFERAQSIKVVENNLTRYFLDTRDHPHWESNDLWYWKTYKIRQRKWHRMGEYCRSNLDWDWDLSSSFNHLFEIDKSNKNPLPEYAKCQIVTGQPGIFDLPMVRGGTDGRALNVTIPGKGPNVLEKIHVRYETETAEVKYKTFYPGSSVEDVASCSGPGPEQESAQETGEFDALLMCASERLLTGM